MWEPEVEMREHYMELFAATDFEDEVSFKWGRIVTFAFPSIFLLAFNLKNLAFWSLVRYVGRMLGVRRAY